MRGRRGERDKGGELRRQRWTGGANVAFCVCYIVVLYCVASLVKLQTTG